MHNEGISTPTGSLSLEVIRAWPDHELSIEETIRHGLPQAGLPDAVNNWRKRNFRNLIRGTRRVMGARLLGQSTYYGSLFLTVFRANGEIERLGLASQRVVTTAGVNKIVAVLNGSDAATGTTFKYHGVGTGNTAEAIGDTALVTEVETRGTGTQTTGGSSNVYRTVGTVTATTTRAIVEHGVFSASTVGTLLDRSVFTVINLANGDSIQATYDLTLPAGG